MEGSSLDTGFRYWTRERGSSTLRIGPKTIMKEVGTGPSRRFVGRRRVEDTPFIVEIIENPWSKDLAEHSRGEGKPLTKVLITKTLLTKHGGTITCRGCGYSIEEGETAIKRRVNNHIRYFHQKCIYTEKR